MNYTQEQDIFLSSLKGIRYKPLDNPYLVFEPLTVVLNLEKLDMDHMALFPYEDRTLRAFYLFELARRYGDIAMPVDVMLSVEEANTIGKTPFDDVVKYIAEECDTCAKYLPDTYIGMLGDEYGRVTRGFALALKTKALLYAASPLHNPSADEEKWREAGRAAKEVIELKTGNGTPVYVLDPAEKANNITPSPEVILQIMRSESNSFERYNFPVRFTMGQRTSMAGTYPTQDLVDAFQTAAGQHPLSGKRLMGK